jgi:subtilisin family serine protease
MPGLCQDDTAPNDPLFDSQWYLFSPDDPRGQPGSINACAAWKRVKSAEPVVVAIVGAGFNFTHPDLAKNIWTNPRETLNSQDDDGDGLVDDLHGWDFASNDMNPVSQPFQEQDDHDTMVACLIGAVPNNGLGIAGVGRNVRLMPIRVAGEVNSRKDAPAEGFKYAVKHGAKVIVCTIRAPQLFPRIIPALEEAQGADVLFVCPAGNRPNHNIDDEFKPIAHLSNVLIVAGSLKDGSLAPLSYGSSVQVAAPCSDMQLLSFNRYVETKSMGTSWATPIAAAVAATVISQEPRLTPKKVIERLKTCGVSDSGMRAKIAGGRIDMLNAVINGGDDR